MPTETIQHEQELLHLAADGDRKAYGDLYTFYYPTLHSSLSFLAKSDDEAADLLQETFVKAWISRETLVLVRSFPDYIFTVARHLLFDRLRKAKTRLRAETEYQVRRPEESPLLDDALLYKQYYQAAYEALQSLSGQKRTIFLLRTQEGLTLDEIAQQTGISRSAVKKHLYAALKHLKDVLVQHGDWLGILLILWYSLHEK